MGNALTVVNAEERPTTVALVRPAVAPAALVQVHREVTDLIAQCLEKDRDYGVIPGTGTKPTLLKPGAERLAIAFGTYPTYEIVEREVDHDRTVTWTKRKKVWRNQFRGDKSFDWQEETGASLGLYRYVVRCTLVRREDSAVVAEGIGSCSTTESKYIDRPRDCENTALKMAQKRALIAAVLNGFGLSDRFTQDVEDLPREMFEREDGGRSTGSRGGASRPAPQPAQLEDAEEVPDTAAEATLNAIAERMMHPTITDEERDQLRAWSAGQPSAVDAARTMARLENRIARREAKARTERQANAA